MRTCTKCKCNDDSLPTGSYWINDSLCSTCAGEDEKDAQVQVLNGVNDEDNFNRSND